MRIRAKSSKTPSFWCEAANVKNACQRSSSNRLNGNRYKNLFKSLARISHESKLTAESNGCAKAGETVVKQSFLPAKKRRVKSVDCNSEKQFGKENAESYHESSGHSYLKDANFWDSRSRLEWEEQQSSDTQSTNCQLDVALGEENIACPVSALGGDLTHCNGKRDVRVSESNACANAEKEVVNRSFSPLKKRRVDSNSEKQFSLDNRAASGHKPDSYSHSKDAKNFNARRILELGEPERKEKHLTSSQVDNKRGKEYVACSICELGGDLLRCDGKGCKRSFHLYCVDPPFTFPPPGIWHCICCVEKKIKIDIYSVSEGPESIVDAREVVLDNEVGKEEQYLVKYRGLAHVHNRWIPGREIRKEAKSLSHKPQVERIKWKAEWSVPHRLLQKRQLCFDKQFDSDMHDCQNEWLVKWTGLGYNRATWELENASFLRSPEAFKLIRDFENRHKDAKRLICASEKDEERETPSNGMIESPYEGPTGIHSQHENNIEKLRSCWFKRQSSVLFENEERFGKLVLFILSLKDNNNLPFLIVTPNSLILEWEAEFSKHDSSNFVVYKGNKDVRSSIRSLEFHNENGCIMFQVLLASPSIVIQDLSILGGLNWGGVIVDDCQRRVIYDNLNRFKALKTDMRLLIANDHIMDQRCIYNNLLSFINSEIDGEKESNFDRDDSDTDDDISNMKKKLSSFIAYECKNQDPGFSEYWVPVMLSNVQLEQYCAALLSKSVFLCSYQRNELTNSLHELLVFERECCDHPYLVDLDHSLRKSLTKNLTMGERLDAEIKMSGKLQLLDRCLLHIKEQNLRVLIVFQPCVRPGKISTGDILDDFILQRFGKDSYVRIGGENICPSKKRAVLKLFNNEEGTQFVFLLERRACLSSIKLSSIDTVILFDSDWDPLNDLKSLRRLSFQSQFQELKIFRLYSIHTVEEMVLILAKQGLCPDNLNNAKRNTCNKLVTWGSLHLFDKLDQFHVQNDSEENPYLENSCSLLNNVVSEFSALLSSDKENTNLDTKIIFKVQQTEGAYANNVSLYGEVEAESGGSISSIEKLMQNESSIVYWTNVLKGRSPRWKFLSSSSHMVEIEQTDKIPEKIQSTDKNARRIDGMVNGDLISWKPVMRRRNRKRRFYADKMDSSSAGDPACKNSNSLEDIHDNKAGANGKIELSSKKNAGRHHARKTSKSEQDIQDKKAGSNGKIWFSSKTKKGDCISKKRVRKTNFSLGKKSKSGKAGKLIIRDLPVSELIATRLTKNQTHICSVQGSKRQLHQVPKYQSREDSTMFDGYDNSSTFLPPIPAQIDQCLNIATSVNITESFPSSENMETLLACNSQLPQANHSPHFDNSSTFLPQILSQIDQSLEIATSINISELIPSSQNTETLPACSIKLPQASHIPLEVPHSTLLDPQPRDLEIMQKIIEQGSKIKQDMKSLLKAEFEKEIDQVTKKYLKLLEDVEMDLSQKGNELEACFKKVNESKSLVSAFSTNLDSTKAAKSSGTQQGANRSDQSCEKSTTKSLSTTSTTIKGVSSCNSPITSPSQSISFSRHSPLVSYHAVPTNAVRVDTTHLSPSLPLSIPLKPTYPPQIPHMGTIRPVSEIRAQAPHLRGPRLSAEVSPLEYSKTQNGMPTIPHPTTCSMSVNENTFENTLSCPRKAADVSSLSTSDLLSQLFSLQSWFGEM